MAELDGSILDETKRQLGLDPEDDSFDIEIITHINSIFFILHQLGVGPEAGFMISDRSSKWSEFIGVEYIIAVKTYMGLRVRLIFDPPATGPATEAMERQAGQMEWRLNVHMEGVKWGEALATSLPTLESS
jgi:hypothetical protein